MLLFKGITVHHTNSGIHTPYKVHTIQHIREWPHWSALTCVYIAILTRYKPFRWSCKLTCTGRTRYFLSSKTCSTASLKLGYLTRGQSNPGNRSPMRPRKRGTSSKTNLGRFMSRRALISTMSCTGSERKDISIHTCMCTSEGGCVVGWVRVLALCGAVQSLSLHAGLGSLA